MSAESAAGFGGVLADRIGLGRVSVIGLTLQAGGTLVLAVATEPVMGGIGLAVLSMGFVRSAKGSSLWTRALSPLVLSSVT